MPALTHANEQFPSRPIKIVVNQSPGALLDATTRLVAQKMSEHLKQPVVVENRAGADGLLGIRFAKAATADGYTVLAVSNTIAQAPALRHEPGYDLVKDFVGIGPMNQAPLFMVVPASHPSKNLAEFLAQAKANPGKMSFASGGLGTSTWMSAAMFLHQNGLNLLHVPYKGSGAAMPDVLVGRIDTMFDAGSSALPHVREGKLRTYGVSSPKRLAAAPEVPTLAEQGAANYSYTVYLGLVVPAATPKEAVRRLSEALRAATSSEAVRDRFRQQGSEAISMSPEEFTEFLHRDAVRAAKLIADLGIPKQ